MKTILILTIIFSFASCTIKYKEDRPENKAKKKADLAKKKEQQRLKALYDETQWQHQFYEKAVFKIRNAKVVDNLKKLERICDGDEFEFKKSYQLKKISFVKFKKNQVSFKTKSGFQTKAFVTKGVCRELALYKSQTKKKNMQFRKGIKELNLLYVYNVGTYVLDVTFATEFPEVDFFVK